MAAYSVMAHGVMGVEVEWKKSVSECLCVLAFMGRVKSGIRSGFKGLWVESLSFLMHCSNSFFFFCDTPNSTAPKRCQHLQH